MTPFRSEKNTNWEGAFRVPMLVRWPGKIKPGQISNEIIQHHDWLPTFLAMAGDPDVVEKLKKGYKAIGRTYKNHIDGYNLRALSDGRGQGKPAQVVYLSQRRRRRARPALRQLEDRIHGAALPRARCRSGPSRSRGLGCRSSSTCAPIRTNSRTSHRTPTTNGSSITPTSSYGAQAECRTMGSDVQGFPADSAAQQLHYRRGLENDARYAAGVH